MTREEAIETLRNNVCNSHHVYDCTLPTIIVALQALIPELRESEDEQALRIIKKRMCYDPVPISDEDRRIVENWLEKQKESLHIPETCKENADSFTDEDKLRKLIINRIRTSTEMPDGLRELILTYLEKQKEQIPYIDFVIKPHKGDDNNPYDMRVSEAQEYAIKRGFGIPFNDGEVYVDERHLTQTIGNILRWADEHPKEQKPVGWSEEDKDMLAAIEYCVKTKRALAEEHYKWFEEKLKSIRPYCQLEKQKEQNLTEKIASANGISSKVCNGEQKPAEWSEEDWKLLDEVREHIIDVIGDKPDLTPNKIYDGFLDLIDRLKFAKPQLKQEWSKEDKDIIDEAAELALGWGCPNLSAKLKSILSRVKPVEWVDIKDKVNVPYCSSEQGCSGEEIDFALKYSNNVYEELRSRFDTIKGFRIGCNCVTDYVLNACLNSFKWMKEGYNHGWSEEDELTIADLINYFEGDSLECSTEEMVQRIKSLRPQWKPSEEQMEALKFFLDFHRPERNAGTTNWREYDAVESLYEQLKKL